MGQAITVNLTPFFDGLWTLWGLHYGIPADVMLMKLALSRHQTNCWLYRLIERVQRG